MHRKKHLCLSVSAALGFTSLLAVPSIAMAQDQATDTDASDELLEEVIVTGSRIVGQDGFGQTSPVTVVGLEDISSYGFTRVEDVLNNLPQIEASNVAFDSNGATGTATVNLRNLGTERPLVLINGRRMPAGSPLQGGIGADLNQIPAALVDRVEVLTGGASATYGSDAVAGVVNFITKRDFEGFAFDYQYAFYQSKNDNDILQLSRDAGFDVPEDDVTDGFTTDVSIMIGAPQKFPT